MREVTFDEPVAETYDADSAGMFDPAGCRGHRHRRLRAHARPAACQAAAHLRPSGRFVVEVMVPQLQKLAPGERLLAFAATPEHLGFDEYDVATQRMWSHHYAFDGDRVRTGSVAFRYAWPAELDLMAQLAGMELEHRWADWQRAPFTG